MTETAPTTTPVRPTKAVRIVTGLCRIYLAGLIATWLFLWLAADRWWPATVLMYIPAWTFGLPLLLLGPAAVVTRARSMAVLLAGALVIGPLMGLCVPWRAWLGSDGGGTRVRVLTCNVHYEQTEAVRFRALLDETKPDIVALQYSRGSDHAVFFDPDSWHVRSHGQFCLASRRPIVGMKPYGDPLTAVRFDVDTSFGTLHIFNIHLATPRDGLLAVQQEGLAGVPELEANIAERRAQSELITGAIAEVRGPLLIAGDFNTPPESAIYREFWSNYTNAYSVAGYGWGQTQFTPRRTATRIDHILVGPIWKVRRCWVGPNIGSEHRPVIADLEWTE